MTRRNAACALAAIAAAAFAVAYREAAAVMLLGNLVSFCG